MSIVKMSKIRLMGHVSCKDNILSALQKTGAVELYEPSEIDCTVTLVNEEEKNYALSILSRAENAIEFYNEQIAKFNDKSKLPDDLSNYTENFFISLDDLNGIAKKEGTLLKIISNCENSEKRLNEIRTERIKLSNLKSQLLPYSVIDESISIFKDTKNAKVFFGTIKTEAKGFIQSVKDNFEYSDAYVLGEGAVLVVLAVALNENADELSKALNEQGFNKCPFDFVMTANQKIKTINDTIASLDTEEENITNEYVAKYKDLKDLKIFADYYAFLVEKASATEKFRRTQKTFILEGFLPSEDCEKVQEEINSVTDAVIVEFSEPTKDDNPPTLTKNNKLVRQTEFITDMYSVPNYREIDPNKVVFFFFMLFMGVIMADIGYGILMIGLGLLLASRIKVDNGARRLWNVIAIGGVFSILFGVLFNSFFGFSILPFSVLPSPTPDLETGVINLETVMALLLACLGLGVVQIAVGYFCKAINAFRSGDTAGGIFDGLIWVLFFVGLIFATFNFLMDYLNVGISDKLRAFFDKLSKPGLYIIVFTLVIAAITAGRAEKGFGKFSKGFGAIYGLINIMSDILSYARLFGLMLSGMIIAQTFNFKLGMPLMANGSVGVIFGALVIALGHVFNIAMGVLGAYIHDSRLQYIEFFSKFYAGEGDKFKPFGLNVKYTYLKK